MTDAGAWPLGHLDRRFDHRQRKALDAEAVDAEVALLGLQQPLPTDARRVGMVGEQRGEALFGQPEELLVLPQRVVGIEADRGQFMVPHATSSAEVIELASNLSCLGRFSTGGRRQGRLPFPSITGPGYTLKSATQSGE